MKSEVSLIGNERCVLDSFCWNFVNYDPILPHHIHISKVDSLIEEVAKRLKLPNDLEIISIM